MADKSHVDELYDLIADIEIAMMTTRRPDGRLVSRPMATQARADGADLWFVTSSDTEKLDELESEPQVNLAYYDTKSREYVSVSGVARVSNDRATIRELYRPDWRAWFPGEGEKTGTAEDPRIVLIGVDVESAMYLKVDKPRPVVLFEVAKGMVTGSTPDVGKVRKVTGREMSGAG
jgi:general stress protein 26